jgi:hypothetical protein
MLSEELLEPPIKVIVSSFHGSSFTEFSHAHVVGVAKPSVTRPTCSPG